MHWMVSHRLSELGNVGEHRCGRSRASKDSTGSEPSRLGQSEIMSKRNKKIQDGERDMDVSANTAEFEAYEPEHKRRGWLFWGGVLLAVLLIAVLLAPTIVTKTSLREYILAQAIPEDVANVSIRDMQVGWFSPIAIEGVHVLDAAGKPLLNVQKVGVNRTLLQLATDYTNLGQIVVDSPTMHLSLRPDGSNLEDTVAKLMEATSTEEVTEQTESDSTLAITANIKVSNAQVVATEEASGLVWKIEQFNAEADLPKAIEDSWVVIANGTLNGQPFSLKTATPMGLATDAWPLGPTGNAQFEATQLPLEPLRYAALRSGQSIEQIAGALSVNVMANWTPTQNADTNSLPQFATNAVVRTDNLQLISKSLLGNDVLRVAALQLNTQARLANDVVSLDSCDFQSDFGHATLQTTARLSEFSDTAAMISAIRKQQLNTSGQIDIAALTRTLPNTLKIRDDVEVAQGQLVWKIESVPNPDGQGQTRWIGNVDTKDVQILRRGKPIKWKFPLKLDFAVLDGQEIEVEKLQAQSDFFTLAGRGKLRGGTFRAEADLEQLVVELGQVVDLDGLYVHGNLESNLQWSETQPNQLKLTANTTLNEFQMAQNEQLICQEQQLVTVVDATASLSPLNNAPPANAATATTGFQTVTSLDSARFDVVSASDFFIAQLQSPVANPDANSTWPILCRLKGGVGTWFARLKTMGYGDGWDAAGEVDATVRIDANQRGIAVQNLVLDARNVEAATEGIYIKEPAIQIETAGTIDLATYACRFPMTTMGSQSVAFSAHNVSVDMEPHFLVAGDVAYRANIGRLMEYSVTDPNVPSTKISGEATGQMHLEAQEETTTFQVTGDIANFVVVSPPTPPTPGQPGSAGDVVWQEPKVTLESTGTYHAIKDQLDLNGAKIDGQAINLVAKGVATQLSTNPTVDITGEYGYQLEGLMAIFRDMIGEDIQLAGNKRQAFAMKGPLFPSEPGSKDLVSKQLVAQTSIGWDAANVYSTPLGAAQVNAVLQEGVMHMSPLQLAVGEGAVNVAPAVYVNTEPLWMTLQPATVVDHVRITPEMTKTWMKYLAPLLADATNAEGAFSVDLARAEIPLMAPTEGNIQGQFIVHGGVLGPGPLATQFIELATQIKQMTGQGQGQITDSTKTWVELGEQRVNFQVAENRVYHEGFQMIVDGVPIRTRGWVGMVDESIDVMAEVPIMDAWIQGNPALAGLAGQTIQIPVSGTTSKPQLDRQALAKATTQLAKNAGMGFLQNELGKQLQKRLGGGTIQEAIGGGQEGLNSTLQNEIGKQLNKLFK